MPNYQNGKIYTLRSLSHPELIYIGSTTQKLSTRLGGHKANFKRWSVDKTRSYTTSFEVIKHGDSYIELLELAPCSSKIELSQIEGKHIRLTKCVNIRIPGRSYTELYKDTFGVKEECTCGAVVCKKVMVRHTNSKKHKATQVVYDFIYS